MNKYLTRDDAPIEPETWRLLDSTMTEAAKNVLTGRRFLPIECPYGLGLKTVSLADPPINSDAPVKSGAIPLYLFQRMFTLSKRDLAAYERDKLFIDITEVSRKARECALMEDSIIYNGIENAPGLLSTQGSSSFGLSSWEQVGTSAEDIIKAVTLLDDAGFHGPYSLALTPARYNLLLRRYPNGEMTELQHLRVIVTEGIFKSPALQRNGVLIASGLQQASVILGQDMSVGFIGPAGERLEFSISESLALTIREPRSICVLT